MTVQVEIGGAEGWVCPLHIDVYNIYVYARRYELKRLNGAGKRRRVIRAPRRIRVGDMIRRLIDSILGGLFEPFFFYTDRDLY